MYKMESVEGSLAKRVVGKSLTLGDTTYKYGKEYGFDETKLTNKSDYVVYLDENGFALWVDDSEFAVDAYALVLAYTNKTSSYWDGNKAELLFTDGTTKVVTLNKDYGSNAFQKGDVVRFKVEDDGEYKLTEVADATEGVANFNIANKALSTKNYDADSKTIFVVENNTKDDYNVYTGIKNAPTITGTGTGYAYVKDGVAKVIFVLGGSSVNSSKDITFLAGKSVSKLVTESDTAEYYVYNAVVKGEITTVMVAKYADGDQTQGALTLSGEPVSMLAGANGNIILNTLTSDSDDIITAASYTPGDVTVYTDNGVKKVSTEEIKVGTWDAAAQKAVNGKTLSVASDCAVYLIDDDGNIEAADLSDVKTNADSIAIYTMEDGEITNLFVQLPKA